MGDGVRWLMDFVTRYREIDVGLVSGMEHLEHVIKAVQKAELSVWIATANLKDLMIRTGKSRRLWCSFLEVFDELAARGVELRVLHAALPSRPFRERFDSLPCLVAGGLELRMCPRVHMKVVVIDAEKLYLGSANWTGAGLGARGKHRRNFELGITTRDEQVIDQVQGLFDTIWSGASCPRCALRDLCELPLDEIAEQGA